MNSSRSFLTTAPIVTTGFFALLIGPSVAVAQPKDDTDIRSDVELRRRLEPLLPSVRGALQGNNEDAQRAALAVIADFPPGLLVQANLAGLLATFLERDIKDPTIVALGIRSYGKSYPEKPETAAKVLERYAKSEHVEIRRAAADAVASLLQISIPSGRTVETATYFIDMSRVTLPTIGTLLEEKDPAAQRAALVAVQTVARVVIDLYSFDTGPIGEDPKPKGRAERFAPLAPVLKGIADVVPRLAHPLESTDPETRTAAARTIEYLAGIRRVAMGPSAPGEPARTDPLGDAWTALMAAVTARMSDPDPSVRLAATESLEALVDAVPARPLLRRATTDQSVFVRWAAARALGRAAPPKADDASVADDVASLNRLVADPDLDVRMAALNALARYGKAAHSASPAVLVAAGRGDIEPRVVAFKTLAAMESEAAATVPVLIDSLTHTDVRLRRAAAAGLVRFGPEAKAALPELRRAVQSNDSDLRIAAAEAILAIERPARLKDL